MSEIIDLFENDPNVQPFINVIEQIMEMPDDSLTDDIAASIAGAFHGAYTPSLKEQSIQQFVAQLELEGTTLQQAQERVEIVKQAIEDYIDSLNPSERKRQLIKEVFQIFYTIFDEGLERFHKYNIKLPIQLEEGAQAPSYAHEDDAAADLYANETITIKAHSLGNFVHTGVKIGLPVGWSATILPRSSTGTKTPLRLSNSQGLIDAGYRGEIMLLFDNISDSDYTINRGDRLAQLQVKPVYKFKATIVESLDETERGEGGFGSSGT